ncbi:MAG: glycosyltransferase family 2 protein [Clostridia bacterium]|nr:glycosyltransferase family 2 protein [Clostridia bacterium]
MEKITVIIPVYNVESYLKECIESVMAQTFQNLEIILIDDGSTDNSGKICNEYEKKDQRIKVFHQENKGLSGARNTGLRNATGKYIMFIDSDDKFENNACEVMYREIEKTDADYIIGNYINMDDDGTKWEKPVFFLEKYQEMKLSIKDYEKSFYLMNSSVWNKIFRKSFLDQLGVEFEERIPAEDAVFTTYCFIKSNRVFYIPTVIYQYRQRYTNSISNNCSKKYFDGINKAYRMIYENFRDNNELEYYRYFYAKSMNYMMYKFIDSTKLTKEERIQILDEMRWFYELGITIHIPTILKSVQYIIESIVEKDYEQTLKYCEILGQVRQMLPKELKEKMSKPNAETYQAMSNYPR